MGPELLEIDARYAWHPYSGFVERAPIFAVTSAQGVRLRLADGRELIDGMASWWAAIHGYNVPQLNSALEKQSKSIAHVMFGGLTHAPAAALVERLVALTPAELNTVFLADSGSVAVEVAIKMALQYWACQGQTRRHRLLTVRGGYYGDTFAAMSVCDPVTGMHNLFANVLPQQLFASRPHIRFDEAWDTKDTATIESLLAQHADEIAAVIIEPIVQGAGGMWFYHPEYIVKLRQLCDHYGVLLICDEIATGFGRTGKLFACEHANIAPDILCLGKALTGGYMTLAATLCQRHIAEMLSVNPPGALMHGPTFMANPLACAVANASIELLLSSPWQQRIANIENQLNENLSPCRRLSAVADVRTLGAIGVVELEHPIDLNYAAPAFVARGVWVRPFGKLVYVMPPYVITDKELRTVCTAIHDVIVAMPATAGTNTTP